MDVQYDKDTNDVRVALELPGLQKENVLIGVHSDVLTVSGENKAAMLSVNGGTGSSQGACPCRRVSR